MPPAASASPQASARPAMRWRTRDATRHLLEAFIGGFGISLVTGALLLLDVGGSALAQVMLITHLVAGALGLLLFVAYLYAHLKDGREPWVDLLFPWRLIPKIRWDRYAAKRLHGHGLMWANWLVLLSGLVIAFPAVVYLAGYSTWMLPYGSNRWLTWVHDAFTVVVLALLVLHFPAKDKK